MSVKAEGLESLIESVFLQTISRRPSPEEVQISKELLVSGYESRLNPGASPAPVYSHQFRTAVSWSNHLHPDATRIKMEIEQAVRKGDFSTKQLKPDWRERMEDLVWALLNSPEFVLIK